MNAVLEGLSKIVANAPNTHIAHGRRTYALSDPECPQAKAVAFVKTQLERMVAGPPKGEGENGEG